MSTLQVIQGRRGVATTVTIRQTELDDLRDELTARTAEGKELAARLVALSRTAQARVARGISPADVLDEIERLALRHGIRMTAAAADLRRKEVCPDGSETRHAGHGRAA